MPAHSPLGEYAYPELEKMLIERGVKPESLPPAEDLGKVKRRLEGDEKKVLKDVKRVQGKKKKP